MIKKIHFEPVYGVEFQDGDVLPFPTGYRNKAVKTALVDKHKFVITHPNHPPLVLKTRGWAEIHPSLTTMQTNFFFKKKIGRYEIYGDMAGPFKTVAWFALGNNPNNPKDTRWAR